MQPLLTVKELCEYLQVTEQSLIKWRKQGMPFLKIGGAVRFELEEVMNWIKSKNEKE